MSARISSQLPARILDHVRAHALQAGQHLPEQALADALHVSRAPVRVALKALEELGIVRSEPNRGFFLSRGAQEVDGIVFGLAPDDDDVGYMTIAADRLSGALAERVSENELIRRYALPRRQVQQVLHRIAEEGWAERLPGHGWRFLPILTSREAYDQSYRFRATIEAAALMDPGFKVDVTACEAARKQQNALLNGGALQLSRVQLFQINAGFHEMLVGWSGNPFFLDALRRVNRVRRLIEYRVTADRSRLGQQCREHLQLLDLLEAGNLQAAASFLNAHIDGARQIKTAALG